MNNLGTMYEGMGLYEEAVKYFSSALEIYRIYFRERDIAIALINLAGVHQKTTDRQKALDGYGEAKEILERIGARHILATLYNNLATIYYETGEHKKMDDYFDLSLEIHRSQNNLEGQAHSLNNIAVLICKKEPARAKEYINRALAISEQIQDRDGQATYLHNLGAVSSQMNEAEQAVVYYTTALSIRREIQDFVGTKDTLYNLALIRSGLGDYEQSIQLLGEAVALDKKFNYPTLDRDLVALEECQNYHGKNL